MSKRKKNEQSNRYLRPMLVGTAVGAGVTAAIIMLCALFFVIRDMPTSAAMPIALVAAGIGSFLGGVAAAKTMKEQGIIIGALCGVALFSVTFIISLFVSGGTFTIFTPMRFVIMTLSSALGGILGVNSSAKRKMI
ncbi:MAG: TIGR04086 family membrane protein [Clostridia bacterium]|nr:TIGR04086 family membrane protein [Clostridia bacterium]MBQ5597900.1 TIGR04086 family membrane protein [Clostridia bacterium]